MELNKGHIIEALDRTWVAMQYVDSTIADHPLIAEDPKLHAKASILSQLLFDLYQDISNSDIAKELEGEGNG